MTRIILEKTYDDKGKYQGMIVVDTEYDIPTFIAEMKRDEKKGKLGKERVKKYLKILKEKGYDIGEEEPT